jgi:hypothetical protein
MSSSMDLHDTANVPHTGEGGDNPTEQIPFSLVVLLVLKATYSHTWVTLQHEAAEGSAL